MNLSIVPFAPLLSKYVDKARLPQIYESLLCGLCVMKPKNSHLWILNKLRLIKTMDYDDLQWDTFIDDWMRPKHPFVIETALSFIFKSTDEFQPTLEMMALAYSTYNRSIISRVFNAWVIYHISKKQRHKRETKLEELAIFHYKNKWLLQTFTVWKNWTTYRLKRQHVAFEILQHIKQANTCDKVFTAWNKLTKELKKTREYFEKLERGDLEKDDDIFNIGDGEARDDLSSLPIQFSVKIFSHLSIVDLARCAQVCRSWKVITQHNSLWNKLNFERIKNNLTDNIASNILQKTRTSLCHLNFKSCTNLGQKTFLAVSECRNLQDLNLSECSNLNDNLMDSITRGCQALTYLNISYTLITDNAIRCLAKHAGNLQYLSLAFCLRISDQAFEAILTGRVIKKLVYIDLSGCNQITVIGYKNLTEACPKIRFWILNQIPTLSDERIGAITTHCKNIEYFDARGQNKLTDHSIKLLLSKSLRTLKLETSSKITDHSLKDLGRHCHELQHLYISDYQKISDQFLKQFTNLRHLRVLNLADCIKITDQGIKFLMDSPCGPSLKELNLTNCVKITDSALNQIQKRCGQLTHLSVAFCDQFTEFGMEVLGSIPNLEFLNISGTICGDNVIATLGLNGKLKILVASGCVNITDIGVQKFTQSCRNIEHLDLSFCHQVTDAAIKNMAFCCRYITSLNLAACRQLTDLSLQFLSGVCHYLNSLDVSGCIMITNKSLIYIRKGCQRLKQLNIRYCKGISKKAVMKLNSVVPNIQYTCEDPPDYYGY